MKPQGKKYEFHELYLKLEQYCHFISHDKWEREDLIQETFLKAMNKYESQDLTPALLKKIASNQRLDWMRKRKELPQTFINESSMVHEQLNKMMVAELLADKLTIKQGLVYILVEGFQFQLKEVAHTLMISETAVKSILFRARNQLGKMDKDDYKENELDTSDRSNLYYKILKQDDPRELISVFIKKFSLKPSHAKYDVMLMVA